MISTTCPVSPLHSTAICYMLFFKITHNNLHRNRWESNPFALLAIASLPFSVCSSLIRTTDFPSFSNIECCAQKPLYLLNKYEQHRNQNFFSIHQQILNIFLLNWDNETNHHLYSFHLSIYSKYYYAQV